MDPKAKIQLVKNIKSFVGIIAAFFGEEGVRIMDKVVEEWLKSRHKKG